ncbi:MAG: RNA 2',3'-cyclic phosphodiesterase [Elusimicrobia bacterium]|nr:RNA 2',3'-cyclic phosphodiesterase [Elusimicrobiota bacterium]
MPNVRLFVAIPLAEPVRQGVGSIMAELRKVGSGCKWVEPDNLHVTLRFFGSTPSERIPELRSLLDRAAQRPVFDMAFEGLGAFPSWSNPRVVWIGMAEGFEAAGAMAAALGPPDADRPFSAHLTVGRFRSGGDFHGIRTAAENLRFPPLRQRVERLVLFESKLSSRGPAYFSLAESKLGR